MSNAGNLHAWCLRELNLPDDPDACGAGAGNAFGRGRRELTVLPFWTSERAPTWPEELRGVTVGLTQATSARDMLRATQEAVFQRLAQIAEQIAGQALCGVRRNPEIARGIAMSRRRARATVDRVQRARSVVTRRGGVRVGETGGCRTASVAGAGDLAPVAGFLERQSAVAWRWQVEWERVRTNSRRS